MPTSIPVERPACAARDRWRSDVRGADDDHLAPVAYAVHQPEKLRDTRFSTSPLTLSLLGEMASISSEK
jgi:hypothetical protein